MLPVVAPGEICSEHLLANQQNIHCAQVEFVKEGKGREAFFSWMHTCIKL